MTKLELCKEIGELKIQVQKLKRENSFLIDEMLDLTKELGQKPSYYNETKHSWSTAMAHKASLAIKKVFEMRS